MAVTISAKNILNSSIPISRFNKGEAAKIFEEVRSEGVKVVTKNGKAEVILLSPDKYELMIDQIDLLSKK